MASKWRTLLVDPQSHVSDDAFRKIGGDNLDGARPSLTISTARRRLWAGAACPHRGMDREQPGRVSPKASARAPWCWPSSMGRSPAPATPASMAASLSWEAASLDLTDEFPHVVKVSLYAPAPPGYMGPPVRMMLGMSVRTAAMICPGTVWSQAGMRTMPSGVGFHHNSTESAMTSRGQGIAHAHIPWHKPSQMAMVLNSTGRPCLPILPDSDGQPASDGGQGRSPCRSSPPRSGLAHILGPSPIHRRARWAAAPSLG